MAGGKARSNKRSSNSSRSKTVTTIVIAAMCVMGLWLLSPNSLPLPKSTARTATTASTSLSSIKKADDSLEINQIPSFEDTEGNLPQDAIKTDDQIKVEKKDADEQLEMKEIQDNARQESHGKTSRDQIEHDEDVQIANDQEAEEHYQRKNNDDNAQASFPLSGVGYQEREEIQGNPQQETNGATSEDQIHHDEEPLSTSTDQEPDNGNDDNMEGNHEILLDQHISGPKSNEKMDTKMSSISEESSGITPELSEDQKDTYDVVRKDKNRSIHEYKWEPCNVTAGPDYIPCLDNEKAIAKLKSRMHYEHRERHCPEEAPTCLVPLPKGYKKKVKWPQSRDKIWYANVPRTVLAKVKGHQNWMKVTGEFLTFPGGGTQFIHGAMHYIDFLQEAAPDISWGKHTRVVLDIGCGVASFGGYLFKKDVLTMSMAPKDEHEAQVQFALERGIPAISAVMGSQRLPFPSKVFDLVHCARCRVPWHAEGGVLLLEVNRVLRPGGFFVWSETPVYQKLEEDVRIWKEMSKLTMSMCWELITIKKDKLNSVGVAIYQKPNTNECYDKRKHNHPAMCKSDDDPNASWYIPLQTCIHRVPTEANERGTEWPEEWPDRLQAPPHWLNISQFGFYGKPAPEDFLADYEHWKQVVRDLYRAKLDINWSDIRNIMDMRAVYGGFAAALKDLDVWVMNVVNVDSANTLPLIYERGLFGIYHDWCESFSTYPRTYDLLHADHLFSKLKKRCSIVPVIAEVDRIVRPGGHLIVVDDSTTIGEVESLLKSLHWGVNMTFSTNEQGMLSACKFSWRPDSYAASS